MSFGILSLSCLLLFLSCQPKPPHEKGEFKESDLVELIKLDQSFKLDIKYATDDNFAGQAVYPEARAFLQRPAAEALIKVNKELRNLGYGLVIYDGYRPWSVTKLFWDITPEEDRNFVADPKDGSKHNRGCAVDVGLYKLSSGSIVSMTGEYDEMTERSYADYAGGTAKQRKMRDLLIREMKAQDFDVYAFEWWHYNYKDWKSYRIQNIQFSEIQ